MFFTKCFKKGNCFGLTNVFMFDILTTNLVKNLTFIINHKSICPFLDVQGIIYLLINFIYINIYSILKTNKFLLNLKL